MDGREKCCQCDGSMSYMLIAWVNLGGWEVLAPLGELLPPPP